MPEWYYQDDHQRIVGPIKPRELLDLIRSGGISESTYVRKDDSQWVRSVEINGLWNAAATPEEEFSCPVCQTSIPKPPTRCPNCMKYVDRAVGKIKAVSVSAKQLQRMRLAGTQTQAARTSRTPVHPNVENSGMTSAKSSSHDASDNPKTTWLRSLFGWRKSQ